METAIPAPYVKQIRAAFPDLRFKQVEVNRQGLVNDVVIVDQTRVFRFPKEDWGVVLLKKEAQALALIRRYVDVPLPHFDLSTDGMVSYEFIAGDPLLRDDLLRWNLTSQEALAETLARFLYQIHTIPTEVLATEQIEASDTVRTRQDWLRLYEDIGEQVMPLLMQDSREWVERLFAALIDDPQFMECDPVLVNGDLSPYHILCNRRTRQITGIIDFGTAGLGDPAVDFASILYSYGERFLAQMAPYYPGIGPHVERARFWAGTLELQWLLGGLRSGDPSWFAVHIGRARDILPLGSGW